METVQIEFMLSGTAYYLVWAVIFWGVCVTAWALLWGVPFLNR